jgi:hypothetical protein
MAEPEAVTRILSAAPTEVVLRGSEASDIGFTPRELRTIYEATGRSWSALMAEAQDTEAEDSDRWKAIAWLRLRRRGSTIEWEQMDDVVIRILPDEEEGNPTSGGPPTSSPDSAGTGA